MPEREDFALRAVHEWGAALPQLDATPDELSALIRLSRVAGIQDRIDDQTLRRFESDGIRGSDGFRTLALLRRSSAGLTNSELLAQLGGSKAGVSARMERLTRNGITGRVPSMTDGRSHTNVLTDYGTEVADRLVTDIVTSRKALLANLSASQIAALGDTLAQIIEGINPGG